eukprot:11854030-Alexandrium_andersonii.AAC.1
MDGMAVLLTDTVRGLRARCADCGECVVRVPSLRAGQDVHGSLWLQSRGQCRCQGQPAGGI